MGRKILTLHCREAGKAYIGQAGLLAVPAEAGADEVEGWIQEARIFAAEWAELSAVTQNKLTGKCIRCPLQASLPRLEVAFSILNTLLKLQCNFFMMIASVNLQIF